MVIAYKLIITSYVKPMIRVLNKSMLVKWLLVVILGSFDFKVVRLGNDLSCITCQRSWARDKNIDVKVSWWRHQIESFFRVTGPLWWATKASDAEFSCFRRSAPEQTVNKQSRRRWFETPSRLSWLHCNVKYTNTHRHTCSYIFYLTHDD